MKSLLTLCFATSALLAFAQGHDTTPAEGLKQISFLKGDWTGKQEFVTGGDPMVGDAINSITDAIGSRYLEERMSTTLPGRKPSDTRHFITFDPKSNTFKAWWFNDSSVGAMELEGTMADGKLVLMSKGTPTGNGQTSIFRATYESPSANKLVFKLELKNDSGWQQLFTTTYSKQG